MIGYVKGILEEIEEDCVIVDVNGLGIRILTGGALASQMLGPICRRISYFSIIADILSGFLVKFTAICYIRGVWCYNDIVPQSVDFSYRQIHHSVQKEPIKCVPLPPIKPVIFILAVLWIMNFPTPVR